MNKPDASTLTDMVYICEDFTNADAQMESIRKLLAKLLVPEQLHILSVLFSSYAHEHHNVSIPETFLELTMNGSRHHRKCSRSNVICGLARGVGCMRNDGSDSRLPAKRTPMGMLEYTINFFNADHITKVN